MNLNDLYELTTREKIKVYDCNIKDCDGIFINYENINAIGLRKSLSSTKEKCVLSEELGHYYMDATYSLNSDLITKSRQEYRASKWSFNMLIPYENLVRAIKNGYETNYALADYFDVTEDYIANCIKFYRNKKIDDC